MIVLGIILLIIGAVAAIHILWVIGGILLIVGLALLLVGGTDRALKCDAKFPILRNPETISRAIRKKLRKLDLFPPQCSEGWPERAVQASAIGSVFPWSKPTFIDHRYKPRALPPPGSSAAARFSTFLR